MADNRQFTDHNEIGGTNVYLEDKKLAERTAVSGAASIANLKFLLANDDTEGFNTAIKAYVDEAIRSALGALVNNLDKGTAISRILATDGNNDLGTITPANLSSVLGEKVGIFRYNSAGQTDIPINAGWGGRTILAIASGHADAGDSTISQMTMIRCGYNGDYIKETLLARSVKAETYEIGYSVQNGYLYISKSQVLSGISVTLIVTNI